MLRRLSGVGPIGFACIAFLLYLLPNLTGLASMLPFPSWLTTTVWDVAFIAGGAHLLSATGAFARPRARLGIAAALACALVLTVIVGNLAGTAINLHCVDVGFAVYSDRRAAAPELPAVLLSCVIAPVAEEIVMRGCIYGSLRRRESAMMSALLASIMFAVAHGTVTHLPLTFLLGFVCCIAYEHTRSLLPSIAMHVTANAAALTVVPHLVVPDALLEPPVAGGLWAFVLVGVVALCAIAQRKCGPWYHDGMSTDE